MEAYQGVAILTTNMQHALDPSFLRLTGQSRLILWITGRRGGRQLSGFAAGAFEAADGFLVAADLGGDGFEAVAQLVDLDGETGQGGGVAVAGAVLLDDGAQVDVRLLA
jgi:hypothetical protein